MDKKETGGFIAYLKGDGLQKVIAVGCLIVLYVFFSIFGNHFLYRCESEVSAYPPAGQRERLFEPCPDREFLPQNPGG